MRSFNFSRSYLPILLLVALSLMYACAGVNGKFSDPAPNASDTYLHPKLEEAGEAALVQVDTTRPAGQHNPWKAQVRNILADKCGVCHIASLPTSQPAALAIFDLDQEDWDAAMTDQQVLVLGAMAEKVEELPDSDQMAVVNYINCKLNGKCGH